MMVPVPSTRADDAAEAASPEPTDAGGALVLDEAVAVERAPATPTRRRGFVGWWRRLDKKLLLASLGIAVGLVLIGYGLMASVTGDERSNMPDAIEEISPAFGAIQVPQQTSIIVDLQNGYEGYLVIDGQRLPTIRLDEVSIEVEPGEQVKYPPGARFEPGNATLTFTPGADQDIESFTQGTHTVEVVYWKIIDGENARRRTYSWSFTVV
jgi:hypothetical protein